jgi:hypothetical protein
LMRINVSVAITAWMFVQNKIMISSKKEAFVLMKASFVFSRHQG